MPDNLASKELIIFDLDGTLAPSKSPISAKTARLLLNLLARKKIAVIGGGDYDQFKKQLIGKMNIPANSAKNLFLFPANSTSFYLFKSGKWREIYKQNLAPAKKKKILKALKKYFEQNERENPKKTYGKTIEDRGSQITFSALGQNAPVKEKEEWNKKKDVRKKMVKSLKKLLPEFEIREGGLTSIDITKKGMDKAHGVRQIKKILNMPIKKMIFIGDALYPGGNDYAAKKTGVDCVRVKNPAETEALIRKIVKS